MNIAVTGANGFIGKNLVVWLTREIGGRVVSISHKNSVKELEEALDVADFVFHLAGVNRPQTEDEFRIGNVNFTYRICEYLFQTGRSVPLVFTLNNR